MRVLITGGAGFIGANLCRSLVMTPGITEVRVLDDFSTGSWRNLDGVPVTIFEGSILNPESIRAAISGVSTVVHLAARPSVPRSIADPRATHSANSSGTLNVLEAARASGGRVIAASSSSVYGANPQLPKVETMATRPMSPYAASKLATETYTLAWATSYAMSNLAFRFFNVYGPGQPASHDYAAVVPTFIDRIMRGLPLEVHGDGHQTRDFTFVETVCATLVEAVVSGKTHDGPVNLALGTRTSVNELIEVLREITGADVPVTYLPSRIGDVPHSSADPTLFRSLFPEVPVIPFRDGLEATYKWMVSTN